MFKQKKVEVLVKGAYGAKNFGDDALQHYLIEWFKQNKYNVAFITKKANYLNNLFPNTVLFSQETAFNIKAKTLILGGGTQFFGFKKISTQQKLLFYFKHFSLSKLFFTFQKRVLKKEMSAEKSIGLGLGLGPFKVNSSQFLSAKKQVSQLDKVFTRDRLSFEFSKAINPKTQQFIDICFLPEIIDFSIFKSKKNKVKKVGVIVRDWNLSNEGKEYYNKLQEQVKELESQGYSTTYILFKPEVYWENYLTENKINYLRWDPEIMSIQDFLKTLSQFDLMVSARFHGLIFSSLLGIPCISIAVEQKLEIIKEILPNSLQIWPYPFTDKLIDKIKYVDENYNLVKSVLEKEVISNQQIAEKMFTRLDHILKQA